MTDAEIAGFAGLLDEAAKKLDAVFEMPMPLTMGWHMAPLGYEDVFHFHCVFQPLKRSRTKMKYLAAVEQITGLFLLDLPPEQASAILNGLEQPDE
jgi:UDPglucose--hexose-1-phosphate uridylyltransferase